VDDRGSRWKSAVVADLQHERQICTLNIHNKLIPYNTLHTLPKTVCLYKTCGRFFLVDVDHISYPLKWTFFPTGRLFRGPFVLYSLLSTSHSTQLSSTVAGRRLSTRPAVANCDRHVCHSSSLYLSRWSHIFCLWTTSVELSSVRPQLIGSYCLAISSSVKIVFCFRLIEILTLRS